MPAHRVLASFGDLSPLETENLKRAMAASRRGDSVVLPPKLSGKRSFPKVSRNLAYLDVAVCYRTWNSWKLTELIDEFELAGKRDVSVGEVVAALTIQRCVAPASKLEASRWYARTALPELQGIALGQFNNTRLHRALDALDKIEVPLQECLARRIEAREGRFVSLFLDCTDTWFVGRGPDLAHKRVTKEGLMRRQIGIALMCDAHGFPLRWATVPGNHHEAATMTGMIDQIAELAWAHQVPLVVDRAMGRGVTVEGLLARDVHFVTAVPAPEVAAYSHRIPTGAFDGVVLGDGEEVDEHVQTRLKETALDTGFQSISRNRYVIDLGVFTKGEDVKPATASWLAPSRAKASLTLAQRAQSELDAGATYADLLARYGYSDKQIQRWFGLLALTPPVKLRILAGDSDRVAPEALRILARLPEEQQVAAFEEACHAAGEGPPLLVTGKMAQAFGVPALQLRAVVLFTAERFVDQRRGAAQTLTELSAIVDDLNQRLRSVHSHQSREGAAAKASDALKHRDMLDVFKVEVAELHLGGRTVPQVRLVRDDAVWQRRRRLDGLTLLVAHPALPRSAKEIVELYFAKDQVEKDFQAIKSVLALRPVNHQTDSKVRAHVSLCMLALLLERTIERQLLRAETPMTAAAALHELKTGHLNLYPGDSTPIYSATQADPSQRRILAALGLEKLDDDDAIAETLTPR
jgi:transposase